VSVTTDQGPVLVLLSGGLDSSTLLHHVVKDLGVKHVIALSFDYGQRHDRELKAAAAQAQSLTEVIEHVVMDIHFLGAAIAQGSSLVRGGAEVGDLSELKPGEETQPPTYVPNRNMTLLSLAAACAEARGATEVYYGAQAQDEYGYWDCTEDFLIRINSVLALNRRDAVHIHAPFVHWRKADVVRAALRLGVKVEDTWTCYRGGEKSCGTCPSCVERRKAFLEAGSVDPV